MVKAFDEVVRDARARASATCAPRRTWSRSTASRARPRCAACIRDRLTFRGAWGRGRRVAARVVRLVAHGPVGPGRVLPSAAMLDHEEQFLFKEEILHLSGAMAESGMLDNVEDLLTDVITSPRFDSEVFTLERSLQVMLGRARRDHARRPADGEPGRVRPGRGGAHPARGARAAGRLARPLRPGHRQRAQLPQQPRRHPGPQLRDPGRPRGRPARAPGPPHARALQQRAAVLPRGRLGVLRPDRGHPGAPRAALGRRTPSTRRRSARLKDAVALIERRIAARG